MELRSERISRVWNIASTAPSTIVRKIRISRPVNGSGACKGSSRQGTPNVFSPRMVPSANTSDRNAPGSPPPSTAKRWVSDSRFGRRSWARPWSRKGGVRDSPPTATPGDVVGTDKLMPSCQRLNEPHLRRLLTDYLPYYHGFRTPLSLAMDCPVPRAVELPEAGEVVAVPEVGGLHHHYEQQAA